MISDGQFLLGLLVVLIIGLTFLFKKIDSDGEIPWELSLLLLLSFFTSLILTLIIFFCVRWVDSNSTGYYSRRCNITSIKNSSDGSFMLGCGNIEQTEYYYYYKSVDGYVRGVKPVNDTIHC